MIWFLIPAALALAALAVLKAFPRLYFLQDDEQVLVESFTQRWTVDGPGIVVARPFQRVQRRKGTALGPTDYLRIRDTVTGEMRNERGPRLYLPAATEEVVEQLSAIPLRRNQYVRLMDTHTGVIRVERGETRVYLEPTEDCLEDVQDGVNVDEHTAVVVRDIESGQLALITVPQVFVPAAHQEIVAIRKPILLQDHETVVVRDRTGETVLRRGSDEERSFFLDPYCELVELRWSTGLRKDQRTLKITHIDGRPKFMWHEFEAWTRDNVDLVLGITFFWQIVDVEAMIRATDDASGDVCSHARSAIIQSTSQMTLEQFLSAFHAIVREAVIETDGAFYTERGVRLHAVEVRSIACTSQTSR